MCLLSLLSMLNSARGVGRCFSMGGGGSNFSTQHNYFEPFGRLKNFGGQGGLL